MAVRLLKAALPRPLPTVEQALALVEYHLHRNAAAKQAHVKRWQQRHQGLEVTPLIKPFSP
jgi:hypothetical protein